jgi:hypothetical protein
MSPFYGDLRFYGTFKRYLFKIKKASLNLIDSNEAGVNSLFGSYNPIVDKPYINLR